MLLTPSDSGFPARVVGFAATETNLFTAATAIYR